MFADNLRGLLAEKGRTQGELADFVGVKPNTVSDWLNKGNSPKLQHLYRISEFFAVSFDRIFLGEDTSSAPLDNAARELLTIYNNLDNEGKTIVRAASYYAKDRSTPAVLSSNVPLSKRVDLFPTTEDRDELRDMAVYDLPASAGTGLFLDSEEYTVMDFPANAVPLRANFGVKIRGVSMAPRYNDGDVVFIKRQNAMESGDIGVFLLNGDAYCKKYIKVDGKSFLESLNPEYPPIVIGEYDEVRVIGKVLGSITL